LFIVHNKLGPGFLEKIYQRAIVEELKYQKIPFEVEKKIKIYYKDTLIGYNNIDLIVYDKIILELKAVNNLEKFHISQVLSYLKASEFELALLVNFGTEKMEIKRIVNQKGKIYNHNPPKSSAVSANKTSIIRGSGKRALNMR
jgi:GxxExxY protein